MIIKEDFLTYECFRCGATLTAPTGSWPKSARWWVPPDSSDYCRTCELARQQAGVAELAQALEDGDFIATRNAVPLNSLELKDIVEGPVERFPTVLSDSRVEISPLDWWHIHLVRLRERFQKEHFTLRGSSRCLYQVLPGGRLSVWEGSDSEIPDRDLVEVFTRGAVWNVFHALNSLQGQRADEARRQLCRAAQHQLSSREPRERFEAIWLLMTINQEGHLAEFQRVAEDLSEHPRVRGVAIEAITERLLSANMTESLSNSTLQRTAALTSDPEPEVRWWTCDMASRVSRGIHTRKGEFYEYQFVRPLIEQLQQLTSDPRPAGLGWSVGKMAQDAIAHLEGLNPRPNRPLCYPYDPWWSVAITF